MKNWLWLSLLLVTFLAGCTSIDPALIKTQMANKSIVVVTTVPDELSLSWVGTTPLNNESQVLSGRDWPIRDWIEARTVALLRSSGESRPVRVLVVRPGATVNLLSLIDPSKEVVLNVRAGYGRDQVFDRPPYLTGIGVRQHSSFGSQPASATFVQIVGALSDHEVSKMLGVVSSDSFQKLPYVALGRGAVLLPEVQAMVRDSIRAQIDAAVFDMLRKLGLIGAPASNMSPPPATVAPGVRG